MNLWRLRGDGESDPQQLTKLPPGRDISEITAGSGWVVMSAAPEWHDQIYRLVGDHLELLIGGRVFTPVLSQDGRLAYIRLREGRSEADNMSLVMVRSLATGVDQVVYQSAKDLAVVGWGTAGSLGVVEIDLPNNQSGHIVIVHADGTVQTAGATPSRVLWCPACLMVTSDAIIDLEGQRHPLPGGWLPQTWSPDGRWLLLSKGAQLGLVSPGDTNHVRELGTFPLSVWNVAWQ